MVGEKIQTSPSEIISSQLCIKTIFKNTKMLAYW